MKKLFNWLEIEEAFQKGLIARILIILSLLFFSFGAIFLSIRLIQLMLPNLTSPHWADVLLESALLLFGLVTLWLIRADNLQTASRVILGCLLVTVSLQVYFTGDPANDITGALGMQLFLILAVLLLEKTDRWIATALGISVFAGLNALSRVNYLIPVTGYSSLTKTLFSIFVWLSVSSIISLLLSTAIGVMRREPLLLQQTIDADLYLNENVLTKHNLTYLSTHDALTGLYNRLFFETEFSRLEKSRLYPISIIMADFMELEKINREFGNHSGDQLLIDTGRLFTKVFRQEDVVSRYGGDEFAILLPKADETITRNVLNRIKRHIETYNSRHAVRKIRLAVGTATALRKESLKKKLNLARRSMEGKSVIV